MSTLKGGERRELVNSLNSQFRSPLHEDIGFCKMAEEASELYFSLTNSEIWGNILIWFLAESSMTRLIPLSVNMKLQSVSLA